MESSALALFLTKFWRGDDDDDDDDDDADEGEMCD